jgi:NAD+-dependent protein deacetylase SIR2
LPHPEAVFDISFFRQNPVPFYTLAHELYPGKYQPTYAHCFLRLLNDKGLLLQVFTQNIDCLEREAGVPDDKIIEAHGSFAHQRCIDCQTEFPDDLMKQAVEEEDVPHCIVPQCNGLVKPDIVFFGESLPRKFFESIKVPEQADLGIVMGTSLTVHPFAVLPEIIDEGVPRLLINKDRVGNLGSYAEDVLLLGDCDEGIRKLAEELGWTDELDSLYYQFNPSKPKLGSEKQESKKSRDDTFREEMEKLTKEVEQSLKVASDHKTNIEDRLEKELQGTVAEKSSSQASQNSSQKTKQGPAIDIGQGVEDLGHIFPHIDRKSTL